MSASTDARLPAVVIDCGTGYTKMGYAGNSSPNYIRARAHRSPIAAIPRARPPCLAPRSSARQSLTSLAAAAVPTRIGTRPPKGGKKQPGGVEDLDFLIGDDAEEHRNHYDLSYPIRHGQIDNWDQMERFWQHCIFKYLRCEPEEHCFCLTEPPMNAPENREYTAEIMFETFNVKGLYIAVQAVLALCASWVSKTSKAGHSLTGTVIDSGDGVTHVIPVYEGYAIGSSIKSMPIAGRDITKFVQELLTEREKDIPASEREAVAKHVKERYCYTCPDIVKEFGKYDADPGKWIKEYVGHHPRTKDLFRAEVGFERFMAPEIFFNPEIRDGNFKTSLPDMVDSAIQSCPIDARKPLYNNIVLSGGSSMFKDFGRRLQRDVKKRSDQRLKRSYELSGVETKIDVNVVTHQFQRYAVWFGGSILCQTEEFFQNVRLERFYWFVRWPRAKHGGADRCIRSSSTTSTALPSAGTM